MKKVIISLLVFFAVLFIILNHILIPNTIFSTEKSTPPNELLIERGNRWVEFKEKAIILRFHRLLTKIPLKKASATEANSFLKGKYTRIEYGNHGGKGDILLVDDKGRLFHSLYKSTFRNESRLGWLWWKVDSFFGDRQTAIYYLSAPNEAVVNQLSYINSKTGN